MTKGEKILDIFPKASVKIVDNDEYIYIMLEQDNKWIADFDMEWWNSDNED